MDSSQKKQTPNKSQVMYDPMIIPRVKQYLEENVHQRYLDVGVMSRMLQERYREYSRRKSAPFRQLVEQAYKTVLHSYGLDSNPSSENDDDVGSDLEVMEEPRPDPMNSLLTNMYMNSSSSGGVGGGGSAAKQQAAAGAAASAGGGASGSQNANDAIDISSDDDDGDQADGVVATTTSGKTVTVKATADLAKVVNPIISIQPLSSGTSASPAKNSDAHAAATVAGGVAALLASTGSISIPAAKKRKIHQDGAGGHSGHSGANVAVAMATAHLEAMLNAQNAATGSPSAAAAAAAAAAAVLTLTANNTTSSSTSGKPSGNNSNAATSGANHKLQLRTENRSTASPVTAASASNNSNYRGAVNGGSAAPVATGSGGGGGGGKSTASAAASNGLRKPKCKFQIQESPMTFDDVGGMDRILKELCELLLHIKHPEVYRHIGLPPPRGFLLHGPPGCGKTLLAQAIAGQLDVLLIQVAATELIGGVSGESEERIRDLFEQAAAIAPCVLFIDEIDAISSNRQNAQKDMERRIVAQLLQSLDGLSRHPHGDQVLIIGATNRADTIDPSLRRVGRFDQEISLGIPDRAAREHILRVICADLRLTQPFDYDWIAALTPGYVGADLLALATRAASIAVKRAFSGAKASDQLRRKSARRATEARAASGELVATVNLLDDTAVEEEEQAEAVKKVVQEAPAVEEQKKKEEVVVAVAVVDEAASKMAVDEDAAAVAVVEAVLGTDEAAAASAEKAADETAAAPVAPEATAAAAVNGEAAKAATDTQEPMDTDDATTAAAVGEEKDDAQKKEETEKTAKDTLIEEAKSSETDTDTAAKPDEAAAKTTDSDGVAETAAETATAAAPSAMETDVSTDEKTTAVAASVVETATTPTETAPAAETSSAATTATAIPDTPTDADASASAINVDDIVDLSDDETTVANTSASQHQSSLLTDSTVRLALSLDEMLSWLSTDEPIIDATEMRQLAITMTDFCAAVKVVQPSAKREGFITVPDVTWADIGALHAIREELQLAVLAPVRYPRKLEALGLKSPSGVLLCGPPGCGKTLLAKAVANEAGINFISVKGPELLNMYVGESERAVRQCFQRARNSAPCVIFFDEFDALCPTRSGSGENTSSSRVVNQLLTEMDGVEERKGVFLMAATNRPDIVDPAVMRPGRLDKILYVGLPGEQERAEILEALTKSKPLLAEDVSHVELAAMTDSFTGADLAGLVRQAALQALRASIAGALAAPAGPRAASEDAEAEAAAAADEPICVRREHFVRALTLIRPSVSEEDKRHYLRLQKKYTVMPPVSTATSTNEPPTQ